MNPGVQLAESLAERLGGEGKPIDRCRLFSGVRDGELVILTAERAEKIAKRLQRQEDELRRLRRRKRKEWH